MRQRAFVSAGDAGNGCRPRFAFRRFAPAFFLKPEAPDPVTQCRFDVCNACDLAVLPDICAPEAELFEHPATN